MCGIAGIFDPLADLVPRDEAACAKMASALVHRGPDEAGWHRSPHVVFAHRRLSIIDLSSGQQPMRTRDGKVTLVFNGEIYNFQEVRSALEARGHAFQTHSDTEVILIGYREWGKAVLSRLKGMFAFVLHDSEANCVFGARDPLGKKPLYLRQAGTQLYFSSELESLCESGSVSGELSPEGLELYFSLGYIPAPYCIYQGVRKLPAAHAFLYSARGMEEWSYWDCASEAQMKLEEPAARARLEGLLDQAVSRRLISEVPLGAFLSGGIDSNLVVSSMAKVSASPVKTFTMGFPGKAKLAGVQDERDAARHAANFYGTQHESLELSPEWEPDHGDPIAGLLRHFGEPLSDPSMIPTYLVCQAARKRVTVVLTGDGGDEPFGGYSFRYLPHLREQKIRRLAPSGILQPMARALAGIWPSTSKLPRAFRLKTLFRNLAVSPLEAFLLDQSPRRLSGTFLDRPSSQGLALNLMRELFEKNPGLDELTRLLYIDTRLYMCENVLVKADRMSMANSIELRSPLLDQDLVAFAFSLPDAFKISGGECKLLLRRLAGKRVDPHILTQPKTGFSFPVDAAMRERWRDKVETKLFAEKSPLRELVPLEPLRKVWKGFLGGDNTHQQFLWAAYVFSVWYWDIHRSRFPR